MKNANRTTIVSFLRRNGITDAKQVQKIISGFDLNGSPNADCNRVQRSSDRNQRSRRRRLMAHAVADEKAAILKSPRCGSSADVFDITRDLVIRHHTYLDLIKRFVVMKSSISVTGEATTHDRAEDVDVAF